MRSRWLCGRPKKPAVSSNSLPGRRCRHGILNDESFDPLIFGREGCRSTMERATSGAGQVRVPVLQKLDHEIHHRSETGSEHYRFEHYRCEHKAYNQ